MTGFVTPFTYRFLQYVDVLNVSVNDKQEKYVRLKMKVKIIRNTLYEYIDILEVSNYIE